MPCYRLSVHQLPRSTYDYRLTSKYAVVMSSRAAKIVRIASKGNGTGWPLLSSYLVTRAIVGE
jgi:hypothetical protein